MSATATPKVELGLGGGFAAALSSFGVNWYWPCSDLSSGPAAVAEVMASPALPLAVTGSPTLGVAGILPEGGTATTFDGATTYASVASALLKVSALTIVAVFKTATVGAGVIQRIAGLGLDTGNSGYMLYLNGADVRLRIGIGGSAAEAKLSDSGGAIAAGQWVCVVGSYDGANVRLACLDIVGNTFSSSDVVALVGSIDYTALTTFRIGQGDTITAAKYFNGTLSGVGVANVAFTSFFTQVVPMQLSTQWTNVTADVLTGDTPAHAVYGIQGSGPLDLSAGTGTFEFALDNSARNSAKLLGYYSPGHANCRTGFTLGIPVRYSEAFGGQTYYKFRGTIKSVTADPGLRLARLAHVTAVDWVNAAALSVPSSISAQISQRADQLVKTLVDGMRLKPAAISIATGIDTFLYALDRVEADSVTVQNELAKIMASEVGQLFVKGDTVQGGTLTFQSRQYRETTFVNAATFSDSMTGLDLTFDLSYLYNIMRTQMTPRTIDASATTVLYSLTGTPYVGPGETITLEGAYRDPLQLAASAGGTAMVQPVLTTDWTANTASDGSGSDLSGWFTATAVYSGYSALFTVTNLGATGGYVTKLQCRGKGIYAYAPLYFTSKNDQSVRVNGPNTLTFEMPYQSDIGVAGAIGGYILNLFKNPVAMATRMEFRADTSSTLMTQALAREPGDRIGIVETVTGATDVISGSTATRGYYIQAVELTHGPGPSLVCSWTLAAASPYGTAWVLDDAVASVLDETTSPGV